MSGLESKLKGVMKDLSGKLAHGSAAGSASDANLEHLRPGALERTSTFKQVCACLQAAPCGCCHHRCVTHAAAAAAG